MPAPCFILSESPFRRNLRAALFRRVHESANRPRAEYVASVSCGHTAPRPPSTAKRNPFVPWRSVMKPNELDRAIAAVREDQPEETAARDAARRVFNRLFETSFLREPVESIRDCS